MKTLVALLMLFVAGAASAQVVIQPQTDTKLSIVFYVKEGTNSPYQGLLQMTPQEYAALKPADLDAMKLAQFNAWKAATKAAQDAAAAQVNTVPQSITSSQARSAILAAGLKDQVEAAVAQADQATQDLWYTAANIERTNPTLISLAKAIGLTDAQVDALFIAGQGM